MKKPVIGISGAHLRDTSGRFHDYKKAYVNDDYVKAVILGGGVPFIIPISDDKELIKDQLASLDGIILSGGEDVDPIHYGEEQLAKVGVPNPLRDSFDMILLEEAQNIKLPIMGICRGYQIINVFNGGTLYQDLSYAEGITLKHDQWSLPHHPSHKVEVSEGSFANEIFEGEQVWVNSFHHLVLKDVAPGFKITGRATDGAPEIIEKEGDDFIIGFQWHPEMMAAKDDKKMINVFKTFIDKASELKGER